MQHFLDLKTCFRNYNSRRQLWLQYEINVPHFRRNSNELIMVVLTAKTCLQNQKVLFLFKIITYFHLSRPYGNVCRWQILSYLDCIRIMWGDLPRRSLVGLLAFQLLYLLLLNCITSIFLFLLFECNFMYLVII